jgi:hypothetical protein
MPARGKLREESRSEYFQRNARFLVVPIRSGLLGMTRQTSFSAACSVPPLQGPPDYSRAPRSPSIDGPRPHAQIETRFADRFTSPAMLCAFGAQTRRSEPAAIYGAITFGMAPLNHQRKRPKRRTRSSSIGRRARLLRLILAECARTGEKSGCSSPITRPSSRPVSGKGVFRSQSGETPTQHSFRVRRDPGAVGRRDRADHMYGHPTTRQYGVLPVCLQRAHVNRSKRAQG